MPGTRKYIKQCRSKQGRTKNQEICNIGSEHPSESFPKRSPNKKDQDFTDSFMDFILLENLPTYYQTVSAGAGRIHRLETTRHSHLRIII